LSSGPAADPRRAAALHTKLDVGAFVASCHHDPLRWVLGAYPWRKPGTPLEHHDGPDVWQLDFLKRLRAHVKANAFDGQTPCAPIRMAVSKGHGVGGSVVAAWLVGWIMSTRPFSQGTITANTSTQLQTKTWAAVQRWTKLSLTSSWFAINMDRMYYIGHKESWFCTPQTCKEQNSEAFAGQHAADSTSFYINDEDSSVPDTIHDVEEGGLTDGEAMQFLFGNPTRSTGRFHKVCFGALRNRYDVVIVDSRTSRFSNKALIKEWEEDHGEDSDFFRVRVRGIPPRASDLQFIPTDLVHAAQSRQVTPLDDEPLLCGLDVARGGADNTVFRFRRGPNARSIRPIKIPGEECRDSMRLVLKAADILDSKYDGRQVEMLFIDGTGIGGPLYDRLCQLGYEKRLMEVQFGAESPDPKYANMRAYMWGRQRDWLKRAAIDGDPILEQDLTGPGYSHDKKDRLLLESKEHMKERDLASPDDGDALGLTFASPVVSKLRPRKAAQRRGRFEGRRGSSGGDRGLGWMS